MSIKWDESLVLGFDEIDSQHRSIFNSYGRLSEAVQLGKPDEIIEEMVNFYFEYLTVHFSAEEKIMDTHRYPKIDLQRQEHGAFIRDIDELKERIVREGATREVALETTGKLLRWLIQHIKKHDMDMVAYVRESVALERKCES